MRTYPIHHVDSFTSKPFEGNPTVVVFDAETLSDHEMAKIAQEMNLSETVFVLPSDVADFCLRYFTRSGDEIKFCGHATVGALFAIAKAQKFGVVKPAIYNFIVQTNAGNLTMQVNAGNMEVPLISYNLPQVDLVSAPYAHHELANALGIPISLFDLTKPLILERTNNYLYFATPSLKELGEVNVDQKKAKEFAQKDRIVIFCGLTAQTFDSQNHVHARAFCPLVGIAEDPFTGSSQGAIAAYLFKHQMIDPTLAMIGSEQGHFLGRPGQVLIEVIKGAQMSYKLHARAIQLYSATLKLP